MIHPQLGGSQNGVHMWSWAAVLTTVLLISTIPTIVYTIAMKSTWRALGHIPTGKISFLAQSDYTIFSQCKICVKERTQILCNSKKALTCLKSFYVAPFNFHKTLWIVCLTLFITHNFYEQFQSYLTSAIPRMGSRLILKVTLGSLSKQ